MAPITGPGQERAQAILGVNCLLLILPVPFVIMRFWARRLTKAKLRFNDYTIIAALLFTTGYNMTAILSSILGGYGQHIQHVTLAELEFTSKMVVAVTMIWPTANTLVKISVLHFYKTIFRDQKMVWATYAIGVLTMGYWLGTFSTAFAICRPFEYNWNKMIPGTCGDTPSYYLSTAIINLAIDVMIVALPLPVLWNLQMDLKRKVYLTFIFSLGAVICVISIVRCYAIATLDFSDITYNIVLDNITTALEPILGVINACLPLLQPVVSRIPYIPIITLIKSFRSGGTSNKRLKSLESLPQSHSYSHTVESGKPHRMHSNEDCYPLTNVDPSHVTVTNEFSVTEHRDRFTNV